MRPLISARSTSSTSAHLNKLLHKVLLEVLNCTNVLHKVLDKKPNCSTTVPVSIFAPHSVKSLEMEEMGMRKKDEIEE